ncbi:MAG: phosphonate metabolism transcriptional regulator PhnF [Hyphomicrobiaceae bacterium]|nr:phosphonate metabolism transcriptional regulator PhnF [Hyphomicrobiaceae bacterium]
MSDLLKRGTGVAVWNQIAQSLEARIASGALARGTRLPTEAELAEQFGVNRHTVRRALSDLAAKGMVKASRGRGTFVARAAITYPISGRTRFSEIISAQSRQPGGRLIGYAETPADAKLAARLGVKPDTPLYELETLRVVDGQPALVATLYFVRDHVPEVISDYAETGSVSEALARAGFTDYRRKTSTIWAEAVSVQDAKLLKVALHTPVLVVESINVDAGGTPLQYSVTRFAGESVQLTVESD